MLKVRERARLYEETHRLGEGGVTRREAEGLTDPAAYAEWRRKKKEEAMITTRVEWEEEWRIAPHGRWTHRLLPSVSEWVDSNARVDYYVTQVMTGRIRFGTPLGAKLESSKEPFYRFGKLQKADK